MQSSPPRPKRRRKVVLGLLASLVVIGGAAGYVFGFYLPNRPENVWNTGLDRSGQAIVSLSEEATDAETYEEVQSLELSGTVSVKSPESTFSGSINSRYDDVSSVTDLSVKMKSDDGNEQDIDLEVLSDLPADSDYPNMFFKYGGLTALGLDAYLPGISQYEGKWISISSQYLAELLPVEESTADQQQKELTQQDAAELAEIIVNTTREYVFTSDTSKSVLVRKAFIGTEKLDGGMTANHYSVSLNKQNARAYCRALVERVMASPAYKRVPYVNVDKIDEDKQTALMSCDEEVSAEIDEKETFDMWIDRKYKLIHKVRFTAREDHKSYLEIGQRFSGGDELPLFIIFHEDKKQYDFRADIKLNKQTSVTTASVEYKSTGDNPVETKATLEIKPYKGSVEIRPPQGAVPLADVLQQLGLGGAVPSGSTNGSGFVSAGESI